MNIPKIIHQIWLGPNKRPDIWMDSWKNDYINKYPEWTYKLWTEKEINEINLTNKKQYENEKFYNGKSDIARYEILYQFGGVFIDENCHIGALNTVVAGAIDPTYIGKNVQTDDHCHIAHNCIINEGVLIAASACIGGSVKVGQNSWIGLGSTLMQKIQVGRRNTIGLGASVLKSTEDDEVWAGNPAKLLKKNN